MNSILTAAQQRYTTKAFDASKRISDAQMAEIEELLRLAPSSINSQPWHFIIAGTPEGKALVAKGTEGAYASNAPKVLNASHVVVLCTRMDVDGAHLQRVVDQEAVDGRIANEAAKAANYKGRSFFLNLHRFQNRDVQHWADKQVYLALGTLLLGVASMGIDACPIEGFDNALLDEALGLRDKGLSSTVVVALGYRSDADVNASLPKSRFSASQVITRV
ncbi:MAG: oxygen-insensitive NAD(P)H nitroreductase [Proteobacteria bacterium]|nr:oxygen-insensitive NAD(P)H nitroreductase [Pseudomonadota bacterium]